MGCSLAKVARKNDPITATLEQYPGRAQQMGCVAELEDGWFGV